jgi:hypothetical protein
MNNAEDCKCLYSTFLGIVDVGSSDEEMRGRIADMSKQETKQPNPHFSVLALAFFMASFLIARAFTTLSPSTVIIVGGGIHVHHFWFGLILLAVGGWMGIVNQNQQIDQLAAVIYGAGGGLIADEVGLLLTFGDYWTGLTYTLIIIFIALVSFSILFLEYREIILAQFWGLTKSGGILYIGIFLGVVSVAFLLTAGNALVFLIAVVMTAAACMLIAFYLVYRLALKPKAMMKSEPKKVARNKATKEQLARQGH